MEGKQKLERVVDHITSKAHKAASMAMENSRLWELQSDKHPWVKTLKKHRSETVNHLIALCFDVYNDSLLETPTARTWPARSLAALRAQSVQAQLAKDWEANIDSFQPPSMALHYRDPVVYAEMLEIVGSLEMKKAGEQLSKAICIALQVDGSTDRQNKDNKFVVARYVTSDNPVELLNLFIGVIQPEGAGAEGLLEAVIQTCKSADVSTAAVVGITTDGEAANTGRISGLWKLLENHLGHGLMTVWCCCHRSDLAMESAIETVPELKLWLSNLTGVATYFRTSPSKMKMLNEQYPDSRSFPPYFEVRFAEHVRNLIVAVLHNLPGCMTVWDKLSTSREKTVKCSAVGMTKVWASTSQQVLLTALMADVTLVLQHLQKSFQSTNLILPDVLTVRDNALRKLSIIRNGPLPGGHEEKFVSNNSTDNTDDFSSVNDDNEGEHARRRVAHKYVTTGRRLWPAVRTEVVQAFINFLESRLNVEEDNTISSMTALLTANTQKV